VAAPASHSDDVERLFRRLVANLAALDPSRLSRPFPVADIARSLVPYRTHRLALRFETSEDYEMAVLRLLAGEGGYAVVQPDDAAQALAREVASANPDTALFHQYGTATVHLDPEHVARAMGRPAAPPPAAPREGPAPPDEEAAPSDEPAPPDDGSVVSIFARTAEGEPRDSGEAQLPFTLEEEPPPGARPATRTRASGSGCAYCGGELPVGRVVLFCPHCGQNVGVVHCPTCGSELDVGWQFCITCGQKVSGDFG